MGEQTVDAGHHLRQRAGDDGDRHQTGDGQRHRARRDRASRPAAAGRSRRAPLRRPPSGPSRSTGSAGGRRRRRCDTADTWRRRRSRARRSTVRRSASRDVSRSGHNTPPTRSATTYPATTPRRRAGLTSRPSGSATSMWKANAGSRQAISRTAIAAGSFVVPSTRRVRRVPARETARRRPPRRRARSAPAGPAGGGGRAVPQRRPTARPVRRRRSASVSGRRRRPDDQARHRETRGDRRGEEAPRRLQPRFAVTGSGREPTGSSKAPGAATRFIGSSRLDSGIGRQGCHLRPQGCQHHLSRDGALSPGRRRRRGRPSCARCARRRRRPAGRG